MYRMVYKRQFPARGDDLISVPVGQRIKGAVLQGL